MTAQEAYNKGVSIIARIVNEPESNVRNTRRVPMPTLRSMLYLNMWSNGFTWQEIGRAAGRGHSNIILGARKWEQIRTERTPGWEQLLDIDEKLSGAMNAGEDERVRVGAILLRYGMPEGNIAEATDRILGKNGKDKMSLK